MSSEGRLHTGTAWTVSPACDEVCPLGENTPGEGRVLGFRWDWGSVRGTPSGPGSLVNNPPEKKGGTHVY